MLSFTASTHLETQTEPRAVSAAGRWQKALADGSSGVAYGIQLIGDFTRSWAGHFRNPARIVSNGAVGVNVCVIPVVESLFHAAGAIPAKSHKPVGWMPIHTRRIRMTSLTSCHC